jgi:hypothetical protein
VLRLLLLLICVFDAPLLYRDPHFGTTREERQGSLQRLGTASLPFPLFAFRRRSWSGDNRQANQNVSAGCIRLTNDDVTDRPHQHEGCRTPRRNTYPLDAIAV